MRVLIVRYGALGDIIMDSPIIQSIKDAHKSDSVSILTSPEYAFCFTKTPGLEVVAFSRKGWLGSLKALRWIRSRYFDRVYDLQSNDRSRILLSLSGIREKAGNHAHFPYTHHPGDIYTGQEHIFERHKKILLCAGVNLSTTKPFLAAPEEQNDKVRAWLLENDLLEKKLALLHAGASPRHPQKRWPFFLQLAKKLCGEGFSVLWLGSNAEAGLNGELAKQTGTDTTNLFSIFELITLGNYAKFALTNDSGPMHVLSCSDTPVYALFGPTDWQRNHAIGHADRVISLNKSNRLWSADDTEEKHRPDLSKLSAELVFDFLKQDFHTMQ